MEAGALAAFATAATEPVKEGVHIPVSELLVIMGHTIAGSLVLVLVTFFSRAILFGRPTNQKDVLVMGQGLLNLLFLTVGITGVMVLVRDNVVRAFAVLAAISLVRFRIRVDEKGLNSALIFAILIGMANAIQQFTLAWMGIGVYVFLLIVAVPLMRVLKLLPSSYPALPPQQQQMPLEQKLPENFVREHVFSAYSREDHLDSIIFKPKQGQRTTKL